jgi:SAM-dependent methyltransferase
MEAQSMALADAANHEREHLAGRWNFLRDTREVGRYGVVSAYLHHFIESGSVLDLGCGEALLFPYLDAGRIRRYVGLDISATALDRAKIDPERARLRQISLEDYVPEPGERFDAILFNEVLGFVRDPLHQIARYRDFLAPGGIVILSLYQVPRESSGARKLTQAIWDMLDRDWSVLDETMLVNVGRDLTWRLRVAR